MRCLPVDIQRCDKERNDEHETSSQGIEYLHKILSVTLSLRELHNIHAFASIPYGTNFNQYRVQTH